MISVAVLITCHNRRSKTLTALQRLHEATLPQHSRFGIFLVDDGSSDGTAEAVSAAYPSVEVIKGDGSLFWNGGMRLAWSHAAKVGFDYYLWLNDDTFLEPDGLLKLFAALAAQRAQVGQEGIIVGSAREPTSDRASFGVFSFRGVEAPPTQPGPIEIFNGNAVLVSAHAFSRLGNLSPAYRHCFGDIDYGLRARRADIPVWAASGFVATCAGNGLPLWQSPEVPLKTRWRIMHSPKGCPPHELRHFARLARGSLWPLVIVRLYLRVIFPQWFLKARS